MSDRITEIKRDSYIRVPKGTRVYRTDVLFEGSKPASRDQTVMVKNVCEAQDHINSIIDRTAYDAIQSRIQSSRIWSTMPGSGVNVYQTNQDTARNANNAAFLDVVQRDHPKARLVVVEWADKFAFLDEVTPVEAPVKKAKPVSKLQQMVPGSLWEITEDCVVEVEVFNTAHIAAQANFRKAYTGPTDYDRRERWIVEQVAASGIPEKEMRTFGTIAKGSVIECVGKSSSHGYYGDPNDWYNCEKTLGAILPFKFVSGGFTPAAADRVFAHAAKHPKGVQAWFPYKGIEMVAQPQHVPTVQQFVLRDRETGLYLREINAAHKYGWSDTEKGKNPALHMTDSFTKAAKYKDMNHVRLSIMDWTGYYKDLPTSGDGGRPDWLGNGDKVADLPDTWDAVEFDKLAKTEVSAIPLQDWYTRLWTLRTLTVNHGSIVRKLYGDLDKKGEIGAFTHILVMRAEMDNYSYRDELKPEDVEAFNEMVEQANVGRSDIRRAKDGVSMAVAFRDPNAAFLMRMLYRGKLPMAVINIVTLREEVHAAQAA